MSSPPHSIGSRGALPLGLDDPFHCLPGMPWGDRILAWVGHRRSLVWMDGRDSLQTAKTDLECRDPRHSPRSRPRTLPRTLPQYRTPTLQRIIPRPHLKLRNI